MKLVLVQPELSYDPRADNLGTVTRLVEPYADALDANDVVLLPEHFDVRPSRADYERDVTGLARRLGCHVVGGSHHEQRDDGRVNSGIVADPRGSVVGRYEKLRPYADERAAVHQGSGPGEITIGGRNVMVIICADFWFSDVFQRAATLPDVILVPSFSVSRKPTPDYSRALWQHLSVARAYEFGTFVGVSDWAHVATEGHLAPSGVSGFADPTATDPSKLFHAVRGSVAVHQLDFAALDEFRRDRLIRGFFWKRA